MKVTPENNSANYTVKYALVAMTSACIKILQQQNKNTVDFYAKEIINGHFGQMQVEYLKQSSDSYFGWFEMLHEVEKQEAVAQAEHDAFWAQYK